MSLEALLIIVVNVGAWLAFFFGVGVAIYRHVQRRGRRIILSGAGVTLLVIVSLVALNVSFRPSAPQSRPSPGPSILAASWSDSQNHPTLGGVNARDGSLRWRRSLAVSYRGEEPTADGVVYVSDGARYWRAPLGSAARLISGAAA
jgi:hypothetical protein